MAKITIVGDAIVIISAKTLESIKTLEKYRPKALRLYDTDESGVAQEVFVVGAAKGAGSINQYGASFSGETHDEQKLATITMQIPAGIEDVIDYVAEKIGTAILMLNKVEAQMDEAIAEVAAEKAIIRDKITIL